jgi:DNA repair exonuclease SbcCD nuclease subunit
VSEKTLLLTDTHLGLYAASDVWHDIALKIFQAVADFCNRNNIKRIIHLGDFFEKREAINVKSLWYAVRYIGPILNEFNTYLVVGNHDTFYKNKIEPHSLCIFDKFENITVVDEPITLPCGQIGLVPWQCTPMLGVYTLMGHFEINGFKMNEGYTTRRAKIEPEELGMYRKVISGHFHTPMTKNNITYIGAPSQQTFADVGGERGFYVYDERKLDFHEYTDAPLFLKITADKEMSKGLDDELAPSIKDNVVKLIFEEDFGTKVSNMIVEAVQFHKPLKLFPDFGRISAELTEESIPDTAEMADNKEIVREYIKKSEVPEGLDKNTVVEMMINLAKE